jgi:cell division protein FtsW
MALFGLRIGFRRGHAPDYFLLGLICILTLAGLVILNSASSDLGKIKFNDSYYYLKHQIYYGLFLGAIGFAFAYYVPYVFWKKAAIPLFLVCLLFLVMVFTKFGVAAGNATRWLRFGPVSFQPAELLKLSFIVYLAAWLSNARTSRQKNFLEGFLPLVVMFGLVALLLLMQPATSTLAILLLSALGVYFLSGARLSYIGLIVAVGVVGLGVLVLVTPYRMQRVLTFLNKGSDAQGAGYHITQALTAIGSGGLSGVGYGESGAKLGYLPAVIDDSIFAVLAEELGFLGASALIIFFAMLVFRLFWLARKTKDKFGRLLLAGFGSVIALQSIVNMAAISGLLPLTGVPLPFISYGGTALAVFLTMSGIAVNISMYT